MPARTTRPGRPRRDTRPDRVYTELRSLIVRGRLAPGSRLIETEIAKRFGVSRTPVRGALQRLRQEGYILDSPEKRQFRPTVAPLTRQDATEIFQLVGALEGLAARLAAALPDDARQALVTRMRSLNEQFRAASDTARPDHRRLFELDEAFHWSYVEAGAGARLRALHHVVKPQAERYERLYVSFLSGALKPSVLEHEAIALAIAGGTPQLAEQAVISNWHNAADRLGEVIDTVGEQGHW